MLAPCGSRCRSDGATWCMYHIPLVNLVCMRFFDGLDAVAAKVAAGVAALV